MWCFSNNLVLKDDLERDSLIPHIPKNRLSEDLDISHDLQFLDNKDTSIKATRASFRWVLNNDKERPQKDAYKNAWLLNIEDENSESDNNFADRES